MELQALAAYLCRGCVKDTENGGMIDCCLNDRKTWMSNARFPAIMMDSWIKAHWLNSYEEDHKQDRQDNKKILIKGLPFNQLSLKQDGCGIADHVS